MKIFLAGHNGLVGSAILRALQKKKKFKIITIEKKKIKFTGSKKSFFLYKEK